MITSAYFQGTYSVPGLSSTDSGSDVLTNLELFIARYEKEFLKALFGPDMYLAYVSETDTGSNIPAGRWQDFIEGISTYYTDLNGNKQLWNGLCSTSPLTSAIAVYIYCKWLEAQISNTSITGEKQIVVESANNVNLTAKLVTAWNEMVELNREAHLYLISVESAGVKVWTEYIDYINRYNPTNDLHGELFTYKNSLGI